MVLPAHHFPEDGRALAQRSRPLAHEGRAVHDGEGLRLERRQAREDAFRHRGVGEVVRERPGLVAEERVAEAPDHIGGGDRLDLAVLLQEIRAEERALGRLEEEARVPAVGHVRRAAVAPAVPPRHDDLAVRERPRRPVGDLGHLGHVATRLPVSVWEVAASTRTRTTSPGSAGPGKTTVFSCGLLPAIQPAVRRAGPSTSTSTSAPTSRRLISAEIDSWSATRRWRRRAFSASGTASPHFQARVPSRGEYLKRNAES